MIAMYWGGHCGQAPPEATGVPLHSLTLTYNVTWLVKQRHMFVFLFLISNLNLTHFHTSVFIEKHGKQFLSPSSIDLWYFIWNLWHKIYKVKFSPYLRWELWRAPVIQLPGGLSQRTAWGRGFCSRACHVDRVSALSSASIWWSWRSSGFPGCLRRDEPAQGGNPAGKSPRVTQ